jgi:hypothetical protein
MDLYTLTFLGFAVTIVLLYSVYRYMRRSLIALVDDMTKEALEVRKRFDKLQSTVDGIEQRLPTENFWAGSI